MSNLGRMVHNLDNRIQTTDRESTSKRALHTFPEPSVIQNECEEIKKDITERLHV